MIASIDLKFKIANSDCDLRLNPSSGVVLHALILEMINAISPEYALELHSDDNRIRPYHLKNFLIQDGCLIIRICLLNKDLFEILNSCEMLINKDFYLKHYDLNISFASFEIIKETSYSEFIEEYYLSDKVEVANRISSRFYSPTSFKDSQTKLYSPLPDPKLIIWSTLKKWNSFAPDNIKLWDENIYNDLCQKLFIKDLRIRTRKVNLNKIIIPGFTGEIEFGLKGTLQSKRLLHLLFNYSSYSGIGIKCTYGMGSIEIIKQEDKNESRIISDKGANALSSS